MKSALVTGGTGYLGAHLVKALVEAGWSVHLLLRESSDLSLLSQYVEPSSIHIHRGIFKSQDIATLVAKHQTEVVYHLASLFLADHKPEQIAALIASNIAFGTELAQGVVDGGCPIFINTGTTWQFFHSDTYHPVSLYAATKQAFEDILYYYASDHGLRVASLRLCDTYGPGDPRPKLLQHLVRAYHQGTCLEMSPGEQLIDFVHVDDVVQAYLQLATTAAAWPAGIFESFQLSSGQPISLKQLVALLEEVLGTTFAIKWGGRPYRRREVMVPWTAGRTPPHWRPQVPLASGLRALFP